MFPGTLETNPYSIGHTNPLRVMSPAFETTLKEQETKELSHFPKKYNKDFFIYMLFPCFTYTVAVFRLYFFQNSPCSRAGHVVSFAFSSFYDPRFPLRVLRHGWLMGMLAHFRNLWTSGLDSYNPGPSCSKHA